MAYNAAHEPFRSRRGDRVRRASMGLWRDP
jgi:hypothetical protein